MSLLNKIILFLTCAIYLAFGSICNAVTKQSSTKARVDIRAFGDAAVIGGIGLFAKPPQNYVSSRLRDIKHLLSTDINFLNYEAALSRSCSSFSTKPFPFVSSPEGLIQFGKAGFNLIGLANNHSYDCWSPSPAIEAEVSQRIAKYHVPEMAMHGVSRHSDRLWRKIARKTINGVRIGMVSIKAWDNGRHSKVSNLSSRKRVLSALANADVDVRILSLHGGEERSTAPTELMKKISRDFIARYKGDIVFAHHTHTIQGFELLRKKENNRAAVIFYSLGNFLHNGLHAESEGMMAKVQVTKSGVDGSSIEVFPLLSPSRAPSPVTFSSLSKAGNRWRQSNADIAAGSMPAGLKRIIFSLKPVYDIALGYRLIPGRMDPLTLSYLLKR